MGTELALKSRGGEIASKEDPRVIYTSMEEEVRELAVKSSTSLSQGNLFTIMVCFELGTAVAEIRAMTHLGDAKKEQQIQLLTRYWSALGYPCRLGDAYSLCSVATTFTLDYLQSQYDEPLANGQRLSWKHFVALTKVEEAQRGQWLKHVRANSLSGNQLIEEIRSRGLVQNERFGGRKPTVPKTAPVMLNVTRTKLANARKFLEAAKDSFMETCYDYAPDAVDEQYVKLAAQTVEELDQLEEQLRLLRPELEKVRLRAQTVVDKQTEIVDADVVKVVKKVVKKRGAPKRSVKAGK